MLLDIHHSTFGLDARLQQISPCAVDPVDLPLHLRTGLKRAHFGSSGQPLSRFAGSRAAVLAPLFGGEARFSSP